MVNKNQSDPNMDRYQSSLNYVFLDKKEEYQNQNGVARKGGEVNGKENQT